MSINPLLTLPSRANLHQVASAAGSLAVLELSPSGTPIATIQLVHGFTGSKEDFWTLAPLLADAGFHVLAHDNRGHNQSSHFSDYQLEDFADDIIAVQDHFGVGSAHLLGHSLGGMISRLAVIRNPSRFDSYTLFCTGPDASRDTSRYQNFANFVEDKTMAEVWRRLTDKPDPDIAFGPSEDWPAHMKTRWLATDPRALTATVGIIANEIDRTGHLKKTAIPFHSVFGEFDDVWTPERQTLVGQQLGAKISSVAGCGHCPNEEDPATTANILVSFWNSH